MVFGSQAYHIQANAQNSHQIYIPLITKPPQNNAPVVVVDDAYSIDHNSTLAPTVPGVLSNDVYNQGDLLDVLLVTGVSNGTLTLNTDGSFVYSPNPNYSGTDSFTYIINDGINNSNTATVSITIQPCLLNCYFVDAINGSDANPGSSRDHAWRTIQKATNTMVAGDTALVLSGTYNEKVEISTSGITLQAEGKVITKAVYISGNSNIFRGFTITDPTSDWGIRTSGNNNLVENNEIYGTKQDGIWFFGSNNTFRRNYIHDILYSDTAPQTHSDCFQTWSWDWDTTNVLFENNTCIHTETVNTNNAVGYMSRDTTRMKSDGTGTAKMGDVTFRGNLIVIYRPIWAAIGTTDFPNVTIENNTIVNMYGYNDSNTVVMYLTDITNATIVNNLFINQGSTTSWQPYIAMEEGTTKYNIHNNDIYNYNGIPPYRQVLPGDLWMVDPKIVNLSNLDFHLQAGSPLIDAGYNLGSLVTNDLDGVTRPQGASYDIGAYEYPGGK